jgi:hypothetical protein
MKMYKIDPELYYGMLCGSVGVVVVLIFNVIWVIGDGESILIGILTALVVRAWAALLTRKQNVVSHKTVRPSDQKFQRPRG